jgi:VanZ family protein
MSDAPRNHEHPKRLGWRRALWPLALAATVCIASGESDVSPPGFLPSPDKIAHFAVFGLMATLILRAIHDEARPWRGLVVALAAASLYGVADEFRQSFTPGRSVEVGDWVADTAGAAVAVFAYALWPAWRNTLERGWRRAAAPASCSDP